jgi:hypothetical protein
MIRKLQKEKYIQSACGNMPLVGDQVAAFTGVAVGLRMDWRNTHSGRRKPCREGGKLSLYIKKSNNSFSFFV